MGGGGTQQTAKKQNVPKTNADRKPSERTLYARGHRDT